MTKKTARETPNQQQEIDKRLLFILDEAIPVEQTERKKYVSDIAFFYASIFKEKLKHFIGLQMEELAQIGRTELGNNIIRSNISCFRLIDEWMEKMTNEHMGNIENIRSTLDNDKDFINKVKKDYEN